MTGYGGSSKPKALERYDPVEIAEDIKEFILELGYEKCVLVGHDWGGVVSFLVASSKSYFYTFSLALYRTIMNYHEGFELLQSIPRRKMLSRD